MVAALAALGGVPRLARAQESERPALDVEVSLGGISSNAVRNMTCASGCENDGLGAVNTAVQLRTGPVLFGGEAELATTLLGRSEPSAALRGGLGLGSGRVGLEAMADLGLRTYTGIGSGLFRDADGPSPTLPFVGGRVGVTLGLGRRQTARLGAWLVARTDLQRTTVTVVEKSTFNLFGGSDPTMASYTVGGSSFGLFVGGRFEAARLRPAHQRSAETE